MKFLSIEGYLIRSLPSEHKFHLVSQTNGAIFKSVPFVSLVPLWLKNKVCLRTRINRVLRQTISFKTTAFHNMNLYLLSYTELKTYFYLFVSIYAHPFLK